MKFGNWSVTENSIEWNGGGFNRFVIEKTQLLSIEENGEFKGLYKCIMQATEEDWITDDDLYDLNYAFVFAAAIYGLPFDYELFDTTLAKQFELLDDEDDEPF
jgi:hypothetical protein